MNLQILKKRISKNIKACRKHAGITQEQFAKRLEVSLRYAVALESASSPKNVTIETLLKVANALDVDLAEIVCDPKVYSVSKIEAAKLAKRLLEDFIKEQA